MQSYYFLILQHETVSLLDKHKSDLKWH